MCIWKSILLEVALQLGLSLVQFYKNHMSSVSNFSDFSKLISNYFKTFQDIIGIL